MLVEAKQTIKSLLQLLVADLHIEVELPDDRWLMLIEPPLQCLQGLHLRILEPIDQSDLAHVLVGGPANASQRCEDTAGRKPGFDGVG
jgi:hypothetical protein